MPLPKCVQLRCKVSPSLLFYPTGAVRSLSKGEDGKDLLVHRLYPLYPLRFMTIIYL